MARRGHMGDFYRNLMGKNVAFGGANKAETSQRYMCVLFICMVQIFDCAQGSGAQGICCSTAGRARAGRVCRAWSVGKAGCGWGTWGSEAGSCPGCCARRRGCTGGNASANSSCGAICTGSQG